MLKVPVVGPRAVQSGDFGHQRLRQPRLRLMVLMMTMYSFAAAHVRTAAAPVCTAAAAPLRTARGQRILPLLLLDPQLYCILVREDERSLRRKGVDG